MLKSMAGKQSITNEIRGREMRSMRAAVTSRLRGVVLAWGMAGLALPVHASDVDLLIGKLVSKGILTQSDAREIRARFDFPLKAAIVSADRYRT